MQSEREQYRVNDDDGKEGINWLLTAWIDGLDGLHGLAMNGQKNTRRTHTKSEKNIVSGGSEYNTHQICRIIFDGGYKRGNRRHTQTGIQMCMHIAHRYNSIYNCNNYNKSNQCFIFKFDSRRIVVSYIGWRSTVRRRRWSIRCWLKPRQRHSDAKLNSNNAESDDKVNERLAMK